MDVYSFVIANKELFKVIYAIIVISISVVIVLKTHRLFKLSLHNGIRYFRNAFFFFGLGFVSRYFLKFIFDIGALFPYAQISTVLFDFFLIMAGFSLLYSLIWKKLEAESMTRSSLFNPRMLIFSLMTIIIVILGLVWHTSYLFYFSQIVIFLIASLIALANVIKRKSAKLQRWYLTAMILALIAWVLNTLAEIFYQFNQAMLINTYATNMIFFLIFLYGVIRATKVN